MTRFFSYKQFTSADLLENVKKEVQQIESDDLALIFDDDTVHSKAFSNEMNYNFAFPSCGFSFN